MIERFASRNGTVFVGAGISMRSKLPSWAQLIEPLREELGTSVSPSASHLDVAEQYEAAHGRSAMVRYLKRATGDVRYQASHAHDLIVSRPVQRIYTTNFDDLLERAAHNPDFGMILGKVAAQSGPDLKAEAGTRDRYRCIEHWLDCFLQKVRRYERRKRQQLAPASPVRLTGDIPRFKHSPIRLRTLRRLEEILRSDVSVVVVKGEAGIGKTQLVAKAVASMLVPGGAVVVSDVFEQVIWIRWASAAQPHAFSHILRTILNSLESFPSAAPSREDMKEEATRVLEEHRVIVVIEDLEDGSSNDSELAEIKEWLEYLGAEGNPRSRIIVTSRSLDLLGFMVQVGRLNDDEARAMVKEHAKSIMLRRAIPDGLADTDIASLARHTLGNPQAIQLAPGLAFGTGSGSGRRKRPTTEPST